MTEHSDLERLVDEKEREITGQVREQTRDEDDTDKPAFEQDIDPDDVSAKRGGHTSDEPPV